MTASDHRQGMQCIRAWIDRDPFEKYIRRCTTDADIRAAIVAYPEILEQLRSDPGPHATLVAQIVAEHHAAAALLEIEKLLHGTEP